MLLKPLHMLIEFKQEGLLDLERISKLPLSDSDTWREAVEKQGLRMKDFLIVRD
jgi:hypothetical protein